MPDPTLKVVIGLSVREKYKREFGGGMCVRSVSFYFPVWMNYPGTFLSLAYWKTRRRFFVWNIYSLKSTTIDCNDWLRMKKISARVPKEVKHHLPNRPIQMASLPLFFLEGKEAFRKTLKCCVNGYKLIVPNCTAVWERYNRVLFMWYQGND